MAGYRGRLKKRAHRKRVEQEWEKYRTDQQLQKLSKMLVGNDHMKRRMVEMYGTSDSAELIERFILQMVTWFGLLPPPRSEPSSWHSIDSPTPSTGTDGRSTQP